MKEDRRSRSRSPINDRRSRSRSPRRPRNMTSKRCIISNIPYDLKWQEIKDLFRNEVGDVIYVELYTTPDGKPKGTGVIEFKDIDTASLAIEKMHRFEIKDRKLVVREERERDRRQQEPMPRGGRDGPGVMGPAPHNMGGGGGGGMGGGMGNQDRPMGRFENRQSGDSHSNSLNPQVLQQLGIEGPISNTVFVSNLDYKVGWKKLKDVFKLAGKVIRSEIKEDKDGKSRGMGTITFESPMDAVQAISMFNNQVLFDRTMRVKMDGQPTSAARPEPLPTGLKSVGPSLKNLQQMGPEMGGGGGGGMGMGNFGGGGGGSSLGGGGGMSGGMGNMDRVGMGGSGGGGMSGMGSSMTGMGSSFSGMGGGMSGMGSGMGSAGMGMSGMGSMGSSFGGGMSGMGSGMSSGMGMGDSFGSGMGSSGMSGMGSSGMGGGMGSSGMNDNFSGMSSMGSMGGMGTSSGFNTMMDSGRSSGMGNYGGMGGGSSNTGMSSRMDFGSGRDSGRSAGSMPASGGDMKTRADKSTIIVKNLPYSLDWQTLKSRFQSVGDIRFAEISKNDKGRSNGWGLVSFRREEDAQVAVQKMNRVNIEGRDIVVKLLN